MTDLLLKNVRAGRDPVDVLVRGGRIRKIGPALEAEPGMALEDGGGALLLPGLIEGHTHLDKTTWGSPWYVNQVGPALTDRIHNERQWRASTGHDAASHARALARAGGDRGAARRGLDHHRRRHLRPCGGTARRQRRLRRYCRSRAR